MRTILNSILLTALASFIGCGGVDDAPATVKISGEVTYNGKPMPAGEIIFRDKSGSNKSISAQIKDGKYEADCTLGNKRVEITAMRDEKGATAETLETGESGPVLEQYVPEAYNDKSTLTADVKEAGDQKFDFPLKGK